MEVDAKDNGSLIRSYDTNMPKLSLKEAASSLFEEESAPILFQHFPSGDPETITISFLRGVQKEPVMEFPYKGQFYGYLPVGSCNGLTLVCYEHDPMDAGAYGFAVINPVSKERCDLPPIPIKMAPCQIDLDGPCLATGIAFDDSTNTLKTVFFIIIDEDTNAVCTMVHSWGSSSWREIAQNPTYPIRGEGVFGHGRLHWLVDWKPFDIILTDGRKLVWFDVKTEEFGLMDPPKPKEGDHWIDNNQLVDLKGELGFSYFGPFGIKLWVLKQQEEWVLHCCFDLSPILPPYGEYDLEISGCWNNQGDLLLTYNRGERLFVYTLKRGDLREVDLGAPNPCERSEIRMYRGSLLSDAADPGSGEVPAAIRLPMGQGRSKTHVY